MVTLDQVEQLDYKVKKAVVLIDALRTENSKLIAEKRELSNEVAKLSEELSQLKAGQDVQNQVEISILGAIQQLSTVDKPADEEASSEEITADSTEISSANDEALLAGDYQAPNSQPDENLGDNLDNKQDQEPLDIF